MASIIAAVFIGWGLRQSAEYDRQANDHSRGYAAYANNQISQSCLALATIEKANCIAKIRHEQRANERNERDLVAQRQSALWAFIMGAAAVIGMGLSVIGVILVWTTFAETREANVIARSIAAAATAEGDAARKAQILAERAIVHIKSAFFDAAGEKAKSWPVRIKVENVGRTNAQQFRIDYLISDEAVFDWKTTAFVNFGRILSPPVYPRPDLSRPASSQLSGLSDRLYHLPHAARYQLQNVLLFDHRGRSHAKERIRRTA